MASIPFIDRLFKYTIVVAVLLAGVFLSLVAFDRLRTYPRQLEMRLTLMLHGNELSALAKHFENDTDFDTVSVFGPTDISLRKVDGTFLYGEDASKFLARYGSISGRNRLPTIYRTRSGEPFYYGFNFNRKGINGDVALIFRIKSPDKLRKCAGSPPLDREMDCYISINEDWTLHYTWYPRD